MIMEVISKHLAVLKIRRIENGLRSKVYWQRLDNVEVIESRSSEILQPNH